MNPARAIAARLAQLLLRGGPLLATARLLLLAWGIGLAVAAIHLGHWREELTRTLVQLNADAQFRAGVQQRDAVDPAWYRRKALSLLSATERLDRDTSWTLFIPGSWRLFDDLEEQVRLRIEREFGETVVETIRRELYARTSALTGVPQLRAVGDLQPGADCRSPIPQALDRKLSAAAEELPEFAAITDYVAGVERLDAAVQAFFSLQHSGGRPQELRQLVAYTLGAELPGGLADSVRMFHPTDEVNLQPALMQTRLQWATRCSLAKAMGALHTRLLHTNDLIALEQGLAERSAGLFEPGVRAGGFDRTVERYRAVHALLEDQHALLARGRNDWMRQASLQLGPAYQNVLERIARTRLLGPQMVKQLHDQSGVAFAEFRRQFEAAFANRGEPGIVWIEHERRFGLSSERDALRRGLAGLLKMPFMADQAAAPAARSGSALGAVLGEARGLAAARAHFVAQTLPAFPAHVRPAVARLVDGRVSELIYQRAYRGLKAALPANVATPPHLPALRQQRDQVFALQAVLKETGGAGFGERLVATLDGELLRRLAALQEDWLRQPPHQGLANDLAGWQGEALPAWRLLGAADAASLPAAAGRAAARLEALGQQAGALLALGSPALQADPAALRWRTLQEEARRFQARSAESSLLRLERYLAALGPDLRRDNCAERLAAPLPLANGEDDIARRHAEIHEALARRCGELRAQALPPAVAAPLQ